MTQAKKKKGGAEKVEEVTTVAEAATVSFDYIKSNFYRVVSVNGIVGGVSPNGDIHMGVWSQRTPYPRSVIHKVTEAGELGEEVDRIMRDADFIRELEAGLVFTPDMAAAMIKWLERILTKIGQLDGKEAAE